MTRDDQRAQLDFLAKLNDEHLRQHPGEADLLARIESFELAYRMQTEAADLVDFSQGIGRDAEPVRPRQQRSRARSAPSA